MNPSARRFLVLMRRSPSAGERRIPAFTLVKISENSLIISMLPRLISPPSQGGEIKRGSMEIIKEFSDIFTKVKAGIRLSPADGLRLISTKNLRALGFMADFVKRRLHGDRVHYTHSI